MSENSHDGGSTPATDPDETPHAHAWIAPLVSSVVTVPSGLLALLYGALSPMECGSCNGAVADRFHDSWTTAWTVLWIGLILALIVLIATWAVPHQLRHAARRVGLALTAPTVVGVTFVAFMALVDWP
ncbi:DMT family transporter [Streptomyces sp. NPDC045714]|uniref:DMT family transporter n=1 Tax=Streptomyces sp. NPDC045714 TaxID=3154913 RepID=UPI0033E14F7E